MTGKLTPAITTATLADQAYDLLLREISTGAFPPGYPLRELDLVAELGVSRTPVREALLRLAEYGLVEVTGRSARVRRLTPADVVHVYQVRRALEGEAVRLACGRLTAADFARLDAVTPKGRAAGGPQAEAAGYRLDRELHRLLAARSGNPILAQEICKFHDLVQLVHKPVVDRRGRLARELSQHRAIVEALRAGDGRAARRAMLAHLRSACETQARCVEAWAAEGAGDAPRTPARRVTRRPVVDPSLQ